MKHFHKSLFFVLGIFLLMVSCGPTTRVTGSWTNPEVPQQRKYSDILVTAMIDNVNVRQSIESELKNELSNEGVKVTRGFDLFPPSLRDEKMGSKEDLLDAIGQNGFDGILTVALIDKETETRYIPGTYIYAPISRFGYYGNFWGYYNHWYPQVYDRGYYAEDKRYFLETNLYDADSERLIWSAQSETVNPKSILSFSTEFAEMIKNNLKEENLLGRGTTEM
ncbi:hypothetical protein JKA74_05185 [Marivirga sp. S37H4]|uniref:DUF4136 domain-containing protein n=1 Tax=Marivirga aurantiaca TaxID=2802615 RepID=A0A934WWW4_9BACT|nr:hypothetical protein [Marivirga aurantiaca]MBK6264422.1 hypothetical protein [Marivirga aurantiaca]